MLSLFIKWGDISRRHAYEIQCSDVKKLDLTAVTVCQYLFVLILVLKWICAFYCLAFGDVRLQTRQCLHLKIAKPGVHECRSCRTSEKGEARQHVPHTSCSFISAMCAIEYIFDELSMMVWLMWYYANCAVSSIHNVWWLRMHILWLAERTKGCKQFE